MLDCSENVDRTMPSIRPAFPFFTRPKLTVYAKKVVYGSLHNLTKKGVLKCREQKYLQVSR